MVLRTLKNTSRGASGSSPGASGGAPGPGEAPGAPGRLPRRASWEAHLDEKWPGNFSWALLEVTKVLLSPGGSPRALGKRFLEAPNVLLRALGFQAIFRTVLGSKKVPREASGTLKIKVFV